MPTATDRTAPHNLEAERALLGSILLDNDCLKSILETLAQDDFYSQAHRLIFEKMLAISEKKQAIDAVTLSEEFSRNGSLEKAGGMAYLSTLTDGVPIGAAAAVSEYCRIVKDKSTARRLINSAQNLIARAMQGTDDASALIELAQSQVQDIRTEVIDEVRVRKEAKQAKEDKTKRQEEEGAYPRIPKGAWHPAAEIYRKAHENSTEASDNWHYICFYTVMGSLLGRNVATRMGRLIYPNLYCVLVGMVGGDGKDTAVDYSLDFASSLDQDLYVPEELASKESFTLNWKQYNDSNKIVDNHRALLRLSELRALIEKAEQKGTKTIISMLNVQYDGKKFLSNEAIGSRAVIDNPHLSSIMCTASKWMRDMNEMDLETGLGRRLCFVPGDPKAPNPEPDRPDFELMDGLSKQMREVLNYWGSKENKMLKLSPKADKLWKEWYRDYKKRSHGDDLIAVMSIGDRTTCRKIALINAALDRADEFIELHHLERALDFGKFLYEARWPVFSEHGANPYYDIEKKILSMIPPLPGKIPKRRLQQNCRPIDSKTFNDRLKYLQMDDGPLVVKRVGRMSWVERSE